MSKLPGLLRPQRRRTQGEDPGGGPETGPEARGPGLGGLEVSGVDSGGESGEEMEEESAVWNLVEACRGDPNSCSSVPSSELLRPPRAATQIIQGAALKSALLSIIYLK